MRFSTLLLTVGLLRPVLATQQPSKLSPRELDRLTEAPEKRDWVDEIWKEIEQATTCAACHVSHEGLCQHYF